LIIIDLDGVTDATMTLKTNDIHDTGYYVIPYGDNVNEQFSIAGTFKFSLFNKQGTQRLHVTDGRFDWHY
jgi:hypothetical protein